MGSVRDDFTSFHDPMAAYTSLGGDIETSFVTADFPYERRGSLFSSSSGPSLSFGGTPTEVGSIPSTPVGDGHRSTGAMTPADLMLTPESPCPPSWRSYGRQQPAFNGVPHSRYSNTFQDLTRNMVHVGATQDFAHSTSQPMFGRELSFQSLDPLHTSFNAASFPAYHSDMSPSESFSSSTSAARSWDDDDGSSDYIPSMRVVSSSHTVSKARKARSTKTRDRGTIVPGKFVCTEPGCHNKRFARREHLRRHQGSKHSSRRFECLQGRLLGARFCTKLMGLNAISRSDNVNQHSCTHVINGMGKTRNSLCELAIAERCITYGVTTPAEKDKAKKQCLALREHMTKTEDDAVSKGIKITKPRPNTHISHEIMQSFGFDCSQGCPMGRYEVFESDRADGLGPLCMAFVPTPSESRNEPSVELDGDLTLPPEQSSQARARL